MKTKIINGILLVIFVAVCLFFGMSYFVFSVGHSNVIYFDVEQQNVVRCSGTISNLYITSKDNIDNLHFSVLPNKKSCHNFSIKELNKNYLVEVQGGNFNLQNFKLRPETEYEITNHSNGDATDGKLLIRTDKNGLVIYTDKTSCK